LARREYKIGEGREKGEEGETVEGRRGGRAMAKR
jgi:hypothetical protein